MAWTPAEEAATGAYESRTSGILATLTQSLSPSLSFSTANSILVPHSFPAGGRPTRVSGGALLTVSAGCPRRPGTYPHQTRRGGTGNSISFVPSSFPHPHPAPYLALLGPVGAVTSFLTVGRADLGIIFFGSLIGAGRGEGTLPCPSIQQLLALSSA